MSEAKQEILSRIRTSTTKLAMSRAAEYAAIPRAYQQRGTLEAKQRVALLVDRLHDYGCEVYDCADSDLTYTMRRILRERGKLRMLATGDLPFRWLPSEIDFFEDSALTHEDVDSTDGVVTRCALAIASTGTLVLRHAGEEGRRALSLIPDYHLCIVFDHQIVETVPEALRKMSSFGSAPITTISGPSATSDIEMTRIRGVHGPRTLDVILVKSDLESTRG